jgi:serine/threonine protein kinase
MHQLLELNQIVNSTSSGNPCKVEKFLGAGGQGEVYQSKLGSQTVALKWYFPHYLKTDPSIRRRLQKAIEIGNPTEKFLWPIELVGSEKSEGFGYIMPIRPSNYVGIIKLMSGKINPGFNELIKACFQLADSFLVLHSKGLCYRDISFGNVFFDPTNGEILICDNDNVIENGSLEGGILGTPRFMAPEVVRGESKPSTNTDLFSLAVLLFYILTIHHPLEGAKEQAIRCLDAPAMNKLYGHEPIFIYDPQNTSNRPVQGEQDNAILFWGIYPAFIKDLFTRAFTDGIRDPQNGRVRESEWKKAFVKLSDSLIFCGSCGAENFYDADTYKTSGGEAPKCWSCKKDIALPPRIRIDKNVIMLNHNTKLYPHHLGSDYDFSQPVAEVAQHPTNPNIWGLKNLTAKSWSIITPDGSNKIVDAGRSVPLAVGTKVNFGRLEGEIRL